jgi:hypothetical protein
MSVSVTAPQHLVKQPWEVRRYTMTFENLMASTETISTISSITSETRGRGTSDLSITNSGIDDQLIYMTIASGTHAWVYVVEVRITTSSGQLLEGDGTLKVEDR